MTSNYMQEAYNALVRDLKSEISKQCRQNDADMDANTNRETVLFDFIHQSLGMAGVLTAAALVDAHERKQAGDPHYKYGMADVVNERYLGPINPTSTESNA